MITVYFSYMLGVLQTFFQTPAVAAYFQANAPDVASRSSASNDPVELANLMAASAVFDATGNGTLITARNTAIANAVVNADLVSFLASPYLSQISPDPTSLAIAQASVGGGNTLDSIIAVARLNGAVNYQQINLTEGSLAPIAEGAIELGAAFPP